MVNNAALLVSRPKAAEMLGISRETFKRLVAEGLIEEIKLSPRAHPRFRRADVLHLAKSEAAP